MVAHTDLNLCNGFEKYFSSERPRALPYSRLVDIGPGYAILFKNDIIGHEEALSSVSLGGCGNYSWADFKRRIAIAASVARAL